MFDDRDLSFAVADPPYLGRAELWYGGGQKGAQGEKGKRVKGRSSTDREYHPDAAKYDDPQTHIDLMMRLDREYDGWAYAASAKTLHQLAPAITCTGAKVAIWVVTNAIPDGGRIHQGWEALIYKTPRTSRDGAIPEVRDVLTVGHPVSGFVGSKPPEWCRWVLALLGYHPGFDNIVDLFPGTGILTKTIEGMLI